MSRYVIESGVSHHGSPPMWTVVRRNYSDPTLFEPKPRGEAGSEATPKGSSNG